MTTPKLPILRLQEAARSSIPPNTATPPVWRLRHGPFRDRRDIWRLVPDDGVAPLRQRNLFGESDDWLTAEIERCASRPRVVMIGSASARIAAEQPLPPDLAKIIDTLAHHEIVAWLTTAGAFAPTILDALTRNRDHVRVTLTLPALEPSLARALDRHAPLPVERLELMAPLVHRGIAVDVALEPLLPGASDGPDQLQALLQAVASHGIEHVTAGYLVLHDGDAERLQAAIDPPDRAEMILASYADALVLRDGKAMARFLPKARRQRGYATLIALGAALGITVRVSAQSNPDFRAKRDEIPHHVRSLQQSFRERLQPIRDGGALGA